ncbi:terminase large subunit [Caulobacter phage BL94]|nr:terminase large subunit [Caulobacter phage BL94]WCD56239.1 terminase large subunit [Caulobacter phage BL94]
MGAAVLHKDGRVVPLEGEVLQRFVVLAREWVRRNPWSPIPDNDNGPHPQRLAYESQADIVGYGGAAGGGKTDLACGLALTRHRKVMMLRRVGTELTGIEDRLEELVGNKDGYNGQKKIWKRKRWDGVPQQIEFASLPNAGDERGFQGRPHDLLVFDEAANFLEQQVRFLLGWLRSTVKGQKKTALLTFNPPTSADGRWIIDFFGPWLDRSHPNPAKPGELRWFATDPKGKDAEVPDARHFLWAEDGSRIYDFDPLAYFGAERTKIIKPMSRTFIPSRITDNPYLLDTGYMNMLQALPEPLRSQMLNGDFMAGMQDDAFQVIPTAWVEAAQARWKPKDVVPVMDALGVDVARGGDDETVIQARHEGNWYAPPKVYPGKSTPTGHETATFTLMAQRDDAPINIDVIGVGASPYDILRVKPGVQILGVNVSEASHATDKSGRLLFSNLRSELWWKMREELDPDNNTGIALPPDDQGGKKLKADLCAPRWMVKGRTVYIESRDELVKRLGRSADYGSAAILARIPVPKLKLINGAHKAGSRRDHDPYADLG